MSAPPPTRRVRVAFTRSVGARLMAATTLLVMLILAVVTGLWVQSEQNQVRRLTRQEARAFALAMASAWSNELTDQNWNQIRLQLQRVLERDDDFIYLFLTDDRQGGRIVAGAPLELVGTYVPDVVPVSVSETANERGDRARQSQTFLLRDVEFPAGHVRARRGEPILEMAADVAFGDSRTGVLRLGVSLRRVDEVLRDIIEHALAVAGVLLLLALAGAFWASRRLTQPIATLEESAARMADGELTHRADIQRADELGALASAFNRMAGELDSSFARLRATAASFERFVPQKFLHIVAAEGIEKIQVGTHTQRTLTILFSDIRGYTSLSEASTDEQMFHLLNEYLPEMGSAIDQHGGFVDKFIGDAIMALFDDELVDHALDAALAMRARLFALNAKRVSRGERPIEIGIGLHRGDAVIGTVGYQSRMDSTVIGDAVNLASRVEGLTKEYGAPILVTGEVIESLRDPDRFKPRLVAANVKVKGRDEPVKLYAIDDPETPRLSMI